MNSLQFSRKSALTNDLPDVDRMALYDQYGSIAYGVITQIIPQADVAQQVMIDLFASFDRRALSSSTSIVCSVIRLARQKAIDKKQSLLPAEQSNELQLSAIDKSPKQIFNLSFYQGHRPETIAEKLQMPCEIVLSTIRDYFLTFRSSTTNHRS